VTGNGSGNGTSRRTGVGTKSPFTVLYRVCPECRTAHVQLEAGLVPVSEKAVSRIEGDAEGVEIPLEDELKPCEEREGDDFGDKESGEEPNEAADAGSTAANVEKDRTSKKDRPNTRKIVRRVLLRDGRVCANPHCGCREALQVHHLRYRSRGGRTELWNELLVCRRCHALIHQGLLEVSGDPLGTLEWVPAAEKIRLDIQDEIAEFSKAPVIRVVVPPVPVAPVPRSEVGRPVSIRVGNEGTRNESDSTRVENDSTRVESTTAAVGTCLPPPEEELPFEEKYWGPIAAMEKIGYPKKEARQRIAWAYEEFRQQGKPTEGHSAEEAMLNRAIRMARAARK
jgi:hypothetical protein